MGLAFGLEAGAFGMDARGSRRRIESLPLQTAESYDAPQLWEGSTMAKKKPAKKAAAAKKKTAKRSSTTKKGGRKSSTKSPRRAAAKGARKAAGKTAKKSAAKPAARKPAARKPAARKAAEKPAARKVAPKAAARPKAAPLPEAAPPPAAEPAAPAAEMEMERSGTEVVETTSAGIQPLAPEHAAVDDLTSSGNELLDIFQKYDRNRTGYIEQAEFARLLEALGQNITDEELMIAFDIIDTERTGKISWKQFKNWWTSR